MNDGMTLSAADVAAVTRNNESGFGGDFGGWWIILLVLFALGGWGGFGFGGGGFGGGGLQGFATRADINAGFALNGIENGIRGIQQGLCDGFYAQNTTMLQGFNGVNTQVANLGYQLQKCCCDTERAIDGVNYNMANHFCALQNTMNTNTRDIIDSQNCGTRAILDFLVQSKLDEKDAQIAELQRAASQDRQNALLTTAMTQQTEAIVNRIAPYPVPAYQVPNPLAYCYGGYGGYGAYGNGCGCGCGCG